MRLICNFGINDRPGWTTGTRLQRKIYRAWCNMIHRCYDNNPRHYTYSGCVVCDEWRYLSKFAKDIRNLVGYTAWAYSDVTYDLDKDTIGRSKGLFEYSPRSCCFIPRSSNSFEVASRCGMPVDEGTWCCCIKNSVIVYIVRGYPNLCELLTGSKTSTSTIQQACEGVYGHYKPKGIFKGYSFYKYDIDNNQVIDYDGTVVTNY